MIKKNSNIYIVIYIKGKIFKIIAKESSAGFWFDDVYFGNKITYDIIDKKIVTKIGAQVSASLYVGEITIEYVFKNKKLMPQYIRFKKFKKPKIFSNGYERALSYPLSIY